MLIKITILVFVVKLIYGNIIENYLSNSPLEVWKLQKTDYCPAYVVIKAILNVATWILIIASVVYVCFF